MRDRRCTLAQVFIGLSPRAPVRVHRVSRQRFARDLAVHATIVAQCRLTLQRARTIAAAGTPCSLKRLMRKLKAPGRCGCALSVARWCVSAVGLAFRSIGFVVVVLVVEESFGVVEGVGAGLAVVEVVVLARCGRGCPPGWSSLSASRLSGSQARVSLVTVRRVLVQAVTWWAWLWWAGVTSRVWCSRGRWRTA